LEAERGSAARAAAAEAARNSLLDEVATLTARVAALEDMLAAAPTGKSLVGRCKLTASTPELKARLV
jgi:hypothetical protein